MSDLLTQKEIDELLASIKDDDNIDISDKNEALKQIRVYDFRTAKRFPRDQVKTFNIVYESFSRLLVTYLNGTLGVVCDANIVSIEEQTYMEFTNAVSTASILSILKMEPFTGPVLMRLSPEMSYSILECLLGGADSPSKKYRTFTDIDLVILEKVIRQILPLNNESWSKIVEVNTLLDGIETSIQFAQIVPPSDTIILITINVEIAGRQSLMNFCLPYTAIEPISKQLNARLLNQRNASKQKSEEATKSILKKLEPTSVFLKASFKETTVMMDDLINLQVGDVIQMEHKLSDPINIDIGHIPRLKGILGSKENKYAVRVTEINDEGEIDNE